MKFRFLVFALFLSVLFLNACSEDDPGPGDSEDMFVWEEYGLDNRIIHQLKIDGDFLYATTDDGFYRRDLSSSADWQLLGFDGKQTMGMIIYDEDDIIVTTYDPQNAPANSFYRYDGQDWTNFQNDYGAGGNEPVFDITVDPGNQSVIYASGTSVIARSEDQGQTWTKLEGDWEGFGSGLDIIRVNPNDNSELWSGGQNAIETGIILYSEDNGQNWTQKSALIESPSVLKELAFHPTDQDVIYAGWEGGITKTTDGGENWTVIRESTDNRFFFGLDLLDSNPDVIYAGGWLKRFDEPQPLILYRSEDAGETWESFEYQAKDFGGIQELIISSNESELNIYLGLYKGGVMKVKM